MTPAVREWVPSSPLHTKAETMAPRTINPDPVSLELGAIYPEAGAITITLRTCRPSVSCPDCDQLTEQVHSWYQRTLTDLPWQGLAVRFRLHTRRWRCPNPGCGRQIFTERLPEVVVPFARRTVRLAEVVDAIAFALGGEAGARVLATLGLPVSPDTLLNRVRAVEMPACPTPRVIGIDDWAWRKGNRYGTILVDLERHRVIELLPDRDVDTIVTWLRQHPTIEVIARDRGDTYIEAAGAGAPRAQQVADRWHLLHNLVAVVEESLLQHRAAVRAAAEALDPDMQPPAAPLELPDTSSGPIMPNRPRVRLGEHVEARQQRHARREEQYEAIQRLHQAGADVAHIARTVGVSRRTVYRYRDLPEPPPPKQPHRRRRVLDPYEDYLLQRWQEGCHNGRRLWREIRAQGFAYGESNVARFLAPLRRAERDGQPVVPMHRRRQQPTPTASHVASLFLRRPEHVAGEDQRYLDLLIEQDTDVAALYQLTRDFTTMVRERREGALDDWLAAAQASGSAPLRRFAAGLTRDLNAVRAGLREEWSNGQTEGQIHRLKLLKRQMYGRAGFAVLRNRVLQAA
jgi:transposase